MISLHQSRLQTTSLLFERFYSVFTDFDEDVLDGYVVEELFRFIEPEVMSPENWSEGLSPLYCKNCSEHLTKSQDEEIMFVFERVKCACGNPVYRETAGVKILPIDAPLLDTENVKKTIWYHSTTVENWHEKVTSDDTEIPYVHVGSKGAALQRSEEIGTTNSRHIGKRTWLYELTMSDSAEVFHKIAADDNDWPLYAHENIEGVDGDALRYINHWEDVGSISLLVDPRVFTVVKVTEILTEASVKKTLTTV